MTVKRYGTGLNGRIEEMECGAFTGYAEYSELLKERDALAAENAVLKGFGERLSEMRNDLNGTGTGIQGCHEAHVQQVAIEAFDELETPATDSAIANIQDHGVDMAINHLTNKFEGAGQIGVPVMALEWLAEELRKEASNG